jgi:hypothetical protein
MATYAFVNWTDEVGNVIGTLPTLSISVTADTIIRANYVLIAEETTLSGIVTDNSTGLPLSGITINANGYSAITAIDGSYSLALPAGVYQLSVSTIGYNPYSTQVDLSTPGNYSLNIFLIPSAVPQAVISGIVTDESTGSPITGATVSVNGYSTLTSTIGYYSLAVPVGTYQLSVSRSGYQTATSTLDVSAEGDYTVNVPLVAGTSPPPLDNRLLLGAGVILLALFLTR